MIYTHHFSLELSTVTLLAAQKQDGLRQWTVDRYDPAWKRFCDLDLWTHDF